MSKRSTKANRALDLPARPRRTQPAPLSRTYTVAPGPAQVWREAFPPEMCQPLINHWRTAQSEGRGLPPAFDGTDVSPAELVAPPPDYTPAISHLLGKVADHFGLPYVSSTAAAVVARYGPGAGTEWHCDAGERDVSTLHRTVSFTLLLGGGFTDGDLEIEPGGPVELSPGDMCGFTSRTLHRVAPVRDGERFALVAFGGYGRDR